MTLYTRYLNTCPPCSSKTEGEDACYDEKEHEPRKILLERDSFGE